MNAQDAADAYAEAMDAAGETAILRRPGSPNIDVSVRCFITGFTPQEVAGNVDIGERKAIVLAADLAGSVFATGIKPKRDQVVIDGGTRALVILWPGERRIGGQVVAYEMRVAGS